MSSGVSSGVSSGIRTVLLLKSEQGKDNGTRWNKRVENAAETGGWLEGVVAGPQEGLWEGRYCAQGIGRQKTWWAAPRHLAVGGLAPTATHNKLTT